MKKRVIKAENIRPVYMSFVEYAAHIGCGKSTAIKTAKAAGAVRHIGSRALVNVEKADEWIEQQDA